MKRIVFVCSANYYRSRFAEHFFNYLVKALDLAWRAESRGLMVGEWGNIGSISQFTVDALQGRGIPTRNIDRDPIALTRSDFVNADLVVAVKEAEHRQPMERQFPDWAEGVIYWHIDDLDCAEADEALPLLEKKIRGLVGQLRAERERRQAV
jgi:protein-tyrosine phosphatase